jgi:peptidyl-prolyl cis-trans isomerase SurA
MTQPRAILGRAGLALAMLWLGAAPAAAQVHDGVAAVVGDEVILRSEVVNASRRVEERVERRGGPLSVQDRREIRRQALQMLIDQKLILEAAERMELDSSPEEIDLAIEGIAEQEGLTVDQVYAAAARQGMDREQYRDQLATQLAKMKVIESQVRGQIDVDDEEVQALYDKRYGKVEPGVRVRVRHILIPWSENRMQAVELADAIYQEATAGASFAQLAATYSAAPTAESGGLTEFREGEVSKELAPYVFGLGPGEISPPIETMHGVNLLQVLDRYDPGDVEYTEVRDQLYAELAERKLEPEMEKFIETLRKGYYIEVVASDLQ